MAAAASASSAPSSAAAAVSSVHFRPLEDLLKATAAKAARADHWILTKVMTLRSCLQKIGPS